MEYLSLWTLNILYPLSRSHYFLFVFFFYLSLQTQDYLLDYVYIWLCFNCLFISVYNLLEKLGGYLPPRSSAPTDITPLVSVLLEVAGAPLFDLYVDVDLYDRSRTSVFLDLPLKYQADTFFTEKQVQFFKFQLFFNSIRCIFFSLYLSMLFIVKICIQAFSVQFSWCKLIHSIFCTRKQTFNESIINKTSMCPLS